MNDNKLMAWLCFFITFLLLISLGTWQIYRLNWKNSIIEKIDKRIVIESYSPERINDLNIDESEYRNIKLKGHFINDKEVHLYGGSIEFKGKVGYFILTPFETINNEFILVNRGWVPESKKNIITRPDTIINDEVEIEGLILRGEKKKTFTPKNDLDKNLWLWIDLNAIKEYTKLDLVPFFLLQKKINEKDKLPIAKTISPNIRNDHLGYAITWYSLAITLVIVFYFYRKQNLK
ncbi:MAG: SURF1 family protein [Alphaproteobacteria bacterium]